MKKSLALTLAIVTIGIIFALPISAPCALALAPCLFAVGLTFGMIFSLASESLTNTENHVPNLIKKFAALVKRPSCVSWNVKCTVSNPCAKTPYIYTCENTENSMPLCYTTCLVAF